MTIRQILWACLRGLACVMPLAIATPLAAQCGGRSPSFAVPPELWLDGTFRPGLTGLAGNQIPARRDSSQWDSFFPPGFDFGQEIYEGLDVEGDFLYVAYNAGLQVWHIGGSNAENPVFLEARDGWNKGLCQRTANCAPFFQFPPDEEVDFLVEDVVSMAEGDGIHHLIALSGKDPVGFSLWRFNTRTRTLVQLYQDTTRHSRQVRLMVFDHRDESGIYAFSSGEEGVDVYDVRQAIALESCLATSDTSLQCPGVWLGKLGLPMTSYYLDVLKRPSGEILIVSSNGHHRQRGLEIWSLSDPTTPSAAQRLLHRAGSTYGVALFVVGSQEYLSILENRGNHNRLEIYVVGNCGVDGCSLGSPVWQSEPLPPYSVPQHLTFSTSRGTPFLYFGLVANGIVGEHVEQLLDLTSLQPRPPNAGIYEMTSGGPTYQDLCSGEDVGYWGWYHGGNEFGFRNQSPRLGKFNSHSQYFYRAARGLLDVHVWEGSPGIFFDGFESGTLGEWSGSEN